MERSKIRRKDRAITDYHRMLEIMKQCDICRLGLQIAAKFNFSYFNAFFNKTVDTIT